MNNWNTFEKVVIRMVQKHPKKIHIIGSVGSGKTTLARKLSLNLNIPFYQLDNVVWKRNSNGDIRRSEKERSVYLKTLASTDKWIVEGVHNEEWVSVSFQEAEIIIFLDLPYSVRTYRIIKRFILQILGIESANYKPTLKIFLKMFNWNRYFEAVSKANFNMKYKQKYDHKILILTKRDDVNKLLLNIKNNQADKNCFPASKGIR